MMGSAMGIISRVLSESQRRQSVTGEYFQVSAERVSKHTVALIPEWWIFRCVVTTH